MEKKNELQGWGGLLVLIGIGVCLNPIRSFLQILEYYSSFFKNDMWQILTSYQGDFLVKGIEYLVIFEVIFQVLLFLVQVWMVYLFFSKNYLFPKVYIGMTVSVIVFGIGDLFITKSIFESSDLWHDAYFTSFTSSIIFSIITACIWIPYMLLSVRVKQTFIKRKQTIEEELYVDTKAE